jgi:replication factor C subunit 3/5
MTRQLSARAALQVRNRLYELLVNAISPELIIKKLTYELMQKLDSELKHEVCAYAAYFEHRIQLGQKAIMSSWRTRGPTVAVKLAPMGN